MSSSSFFSDVLLQQMRQQADPVADQPVVALLSMPATHEKHDWWNRITTNDAPLPDSLPVAVRTYFEATVSLPTWADERRMRKGQQFFATHAQAILSVLGCLSLPYCYAAADGTQVLWLSQRIRYNTRQRLAETGQFVLDVMAPDAFEKTGKGIRSIQKVRLIHAFSRYYAQRSPQWDPAWGVPVNQEDMAGTHVAFSYIVLRGLEKSGTVWQKEEAEDFLHLWNVVSAMLGVEEKLLPKTLQEAYWLDKTIKKRHFRPSEAGKALCSSLIDCLHETNQTQVSKPFLLTYMRHLLGNDVADMLGLPPAVTEARLLLPVIKSIQLLTNTLYTFLPPDRQRATYTLEQQLKQDAPAGFWLPVGFG